MDIFEHYDIIDGSFSSHQNGAHVYFKQFMPKKLARHAFHFIFQHGAIEYHGGHYDFFKFLMKKFGDRIIISCMDLVGHGYSGGPRAYVKSFDVYEKDFLVFANIIYENVKELNIPTIMMGHSLGGMITLKILIDHKDKFPFKTDRLVLTNPCIKPKLSIPKNILDKIDILSEVLGKLRLPSIYDGSDLTSDPQKAIKFDHDPLNSHFMTVSMGQEILKTAHSLINLSYYIDFPAMFLTSSQDVVVDVNTTKLFMTGIPKNLLTHHHFKNAKHDLLNEKCRQDVFHKIFEYIKDIA